MAGLYVATRLAQAGYSVDLLEARESIIPEPRTLIVTGRLRDLLPDSLLNCTMNEIHRFLLFADGRVRVVELRRPELVIERSLLVRELARENHRVGVKVRLGERFVGLAPVDGTIRLQFRRAGERTLHTDEVQIVIGADGAFSAVRRAAGLSPLPTVPLLQALVSLPAGLDVHTCLVWFVPEQTPYFYWLIPESPRRAAVGVIGEQETSMRRAFTTFLQEQKLEPLQFQEGRIPCYTGWSPCHRRLSGGDVYLVGDAAGHVKVTTVGGVVNGLMGAAGVADTIVTGSYSPILKALRQELDLHLLIRKVLHGWSRQDYARLLKLLNDRARVSLGRYHRDEVAKLLFLVVLNQPALLLMALRSLLTGSSFPPSRLTDSRSKVSPNE
ncbi:MAG: NAD(P)/FAD-dependent oxidoreductase [Syntrophobacterales bacterium]|nr:NAD(P)/FAD-dependent oxidoreductase [Syntrophobacterales bacterium]